jgi:hypothetical protein
MAFNMKSSPTKLFSNLFKGLKAKKTGNIGEEMKSKYSGEAQRADKVARPGESEYQFKVRTRKSRSKKTDKYITKTPEQQAKIDPASEVKIDPKVGMGRYTYKTTPKTKSTKPDWSKAPKVGTQARTNWYMKHNLKLDDTTPDFREIEEFHKTYHSPVEKKSPYKKGIGSYTKKPKGSRGFKMNRNN